MKSSFHLRSVILFALLWPGYSANAQNISIKKILYRGDSVLSYPSDSVSMVSVSLISTLPDGTYYGFWADDTAKLRVILSYVNGKIEGPYTEYSYSTQTISKKQFYSAGKLHGHWIEYDYNLPDEILHEGDHKNGKQIGFQYSYSGNKGNRSPYNTCFYRNDTLVYSKWGADHDSTVYYNGWQRKYYLYPKTKVDSSGGKIVDNKKEGLWRRYYPNGNLASEGEYRHNLKNGPWKEYYENGRLSEEYICDSEKQVGWILTVKAKHDSMGNALDIGVFKDGIGTLRDFYSNGVLRSEEVYSEEDCPDSKKRFSEKGILIREEYYKHCKKEGIEKHYYDSGKLHSELNYSGDEPNGIYTNYYEDGKIRSQGMYKYMYDSFRYKFWHLFPRYRLWRMCGTGRSLAQHMQGKWVEYDSLGNLVSVQHYRYGELHGNSILYYSNGLTEEEGNYKDGLEIGDHKEYDEKGRLTKVSSYDKWGNKKKRVEYDESGKIKEEKVFTISKEDKVKRKRRQKF